MGRAPGCPWTSQPFMFLVSHLLLGHCSSEHPHPRSLFRGSFQCMKTQYNLHMMDGVFEPPLYLVVKPHCAVCQCSMFPHDRCPGQRLALTSSIPCKTVHSETSQSSNNVLNWILSVPPTILWFVTISFSLSYCKDRMDLIYSRVHLCFLLWTVNPHGCWSASSPVIFNNRNLIRASVT